eukprot:CAMPEP_0185614426 /NCGR_PEP_ID=MMETSP0436-20130131/31552_1 /TAXON_ID=626734 ORGANISM="Favella taraikaensis, Strain Fe Narragansett Bay" /NCGR_SAMPLE_ID=MMETSP0436 /ASSEMBLY_ACC=CAM_ASM_000390 /LENGTH=39 /DNA_ID= /DNA_START= /DNA_END= /DNA_ORIENTATION=
MATGGDEAPTKGKKLSDVNLETLKNVIIDQEVLLTTYTD